MGIVAVAGGTGGIGKTIVEELARQKRHEVVVLSRKVRPAVHTLSGIITLTHFQASTISDLGIPALAIDYANTAGITEVLRKHNIDTVISALGLFSEDSAQAQLNLINAAIASKTVKTFIPSEFGIKYTKEILSFHPAAQWWINAADALRKSHLRFTRIIIGWALDYYGFPGVPSNMHPFSYAIDFHNRRAAIPGDGTTPVAFLHSNDLAKYIAAMLDQNSWPEHSAFAGDRMSWRELLKLGEEITGKWSIMNHLSDHN